MIYKKCFCAFCREERQVYSRRHVGLAEAVGSLFVGLIVSMAAWEALDPRGLVFSVLFLMIAEIVISVRWRLALVCPRCGFDALVYLKAPAKAVDMVLRKRESRKQDPLSLLKSQPLTKIPARKKFPELPQRQSSEIPSKNLSPRKPADSLAP